MKRILASTALLVVGLSTPAFATMPMLTDRPNPPSSAARKAWAAKQSDNAVEMWGIQESGRSSRAVALNRLARSCMGEKPPEIVGFGSSRGFDESYCHKRPDTGICADLRSSRAAANAPPPLALQ
jgi:hypothetical protein